MNRKMMLVKTSAKLLPMSQLRPAQSVQRQALVEM